MRITGLTNKFSQSVTLVLAFSSRLHSYFLFLVACGLYFDSSQHSQETSVRSTAAVECLSTAVAFKLLRIRLFFGFLLD